MIQVGRLNEGYHCLDIVPGDDPIIALASRDTVNIFNRNFDLIFSFRPHEKLALVSALRVQIAVAVGSRLSLHKPKSSSSSSWVPIIYAEVESPIASIAWSSPEILLTASDTLKMWKVNAKNAKLDLIWQEKCACTQTMIKCHPGGTSFVTMGPNDRLPKIWQARNSCDEFDFGFQYLNHPVPVLDAHWKVMPENSKTGEVVLITRALDEVSRIWIPLDITQPRFFLWGVIDPKAWTPEVVPLNYHLFYVDAHNIQGVSNSVAEKNFKCLTTVANETPDIFFCIDKSGDLKVWGAESAGKKPLRVGRSLLLNEAKGVVERRLVHAFSRETHFFWLKSTTYALLARSKAGDLSVFLLDLAPILCDDSSCPKLEHVLTLDGHTNNIKKLYRTSDGRAILSAGDCGETIIWRRRQSNEGQLQQLRKQALGIFTEMPKHFSIFHTGRHAVSLNNGKLNIWRTHAGHLEPMGPLEGLDQVDDLALLLTLSREGTLDFGPAYVLAITLTKIAYVWNLDLSENGKQVQSYLLSKSALSFDAKDGTWSCVPVDPMGWIKHAASTSIDDVSQEVFMTISHENGQLCFWRPSPYTKHRWTISGHVDTFRKNIRLARCSSTKKSAVVSSTPEGGDELTIWDSKSSLFSNGLEFSSTFGSQESVKDLDWTCTPDLQSILAVVFEKRVVLFAQRRIEHLTQGDAWIPIREINTSSLSPDPIVESIWLEDGTLVVGTGNKLLSFSKYIDSHTFWTESGLSKHKMPMQTIFDVTFRLNGPLPIYHPHFLLRTLLNGKVDIVKRVVVKLYAVLSDSKYAQKAPDSIPMLEPEEFWVPQTHETTHGNRSPSNGDIFIDGTEIEEVDHLGFGKKVIDYLSDYMSRIAIPYLSNTEQIELVCLINALLEVETQKRSLDDDGQRFYILVRRYAFAKRMSSNRSQGGNALKTRDLMWAFHSDSQDLLLEVAKQAVGGHHYTWPDAKRLGLFLWLKNPTLLRQEMENIARNQYMQNEDRDPTCCSLFYLALGKKRLLQGLWKTVSSHKEKAAMMKFLSNDFSDPRWETAAMKNAFVLLGKQRYEYAAAFFLLGNSLRDAVNVCLKHLNDFQLAIAIARVFEGDDGPNIRDILIGRLLPQTVETGDRWMASWVLWMLGRKDLSIKSIMMPLTNIYAEFYGSMKNGQVSASPIITMSQHFSREDPGLILLYHRLRQKTLQTVKGALEISLKTEFDFVLHTARTLSRMGCDILSVDLVRNWDFGSIVDALSTTTAVSRIKSPVTPDLPVSYARLRRRSSVGEFSIKRRNTLVLDSIENGEAIVKPTTVAATYGEVEDPKTTTSSVPLSKGFNLFNGEAKKSQNASIVNPEFNLEAFGF